MVYTRESENTNEPDGLPFEELHGVLDVVSVVLQQ